MTLLGTGTAVPARDRFPSGTLVRTEGATVLVDLGPGVLRRLPDVGVGLDDIDAVLLTHFHVDHCGDLPALVFGLLNPRYAGRRPLRVMGGTGLGDLWAGLRQAWPRWMRADGYDLAFEEIAPGALRVGDLDVEAVAVEHRPESLAYRLTAPHGGVLAISGDSRPCEALVDAARGADLFLCEASTPDGMELPEHLTPGLAADAAARAGARRLCLTHFYPECEGHDLVAQARARFVGEVILGEDLLELSVG